jgi:DNA-binding transcriptional ArsR family regulator
MLSRSDSVTATELAARLPVTRQAVAKHLASLADAGLVSAAREGREVRYRLTPSPMRETMTWMAAVGAEWDERLDALKRHLGSS